MPKTITENLRLHFDRIIATSWDSNPPTPGDPSSGGGGGGGGDNHDQQWRTAILVLVTIGTGFTIVNATLLVGIGAILITPIIAHLNH